MAKKITLSRKDSYLFLLGVVVAFFIQAVFDSIHEGLTFFGYSSLEILVGSFSTAIVFGIILFLFLRLVKNEKP
jgi:hypothetical protein